MGDSDGVDIVELALVDVELGQLVVVAGQELGEEPIVGMAEGGHLAELVERLCQPARTDHLHLASTSSPTPLSGRSGATVARPTAGVAVRPARRP